MRDLIVEYILFLEVDLVVGFGFTWFSLWSNDLHGTRQTFF